MSHVAEGDLQRVEVEEDAVSRPSRRGLIHCLQKVAWEAKKDVLIGLKGMTLLRVTTFHRKAEKGKGGRGVRGFYILFNGGRWAKQKEVLLL